MEAAANAELEQVLGEAPCHEDVVLLAPGQLYFQCVACGSMVL